MQLLIHNDQILVEEKRVKRSAGRRSSDPGIIEQAAITDLDDLKEDVCHSRAPTDSTFPTWESKASGLMNGCFRGRCS